MSETELTATRTAVARAVKAGDVEAERVARAELAFRSLRRAVWRVRQSGVRLSPGHRDVLCEAVAGIVETAAAASHGRPSAPTADGPAFTFDHEQEARRTAW